MKPMKLGAVGRKLETIVTQALRKSLKSDSSGPLVSVIITTRNKSSYLDFTLSALTHQQFLTGAWEVIVTDCGSIDSTSDVLDRFHECNQLPLVKQNLPHLCTFSQARNQALAIANGKIIVFLGEDRLVSPDFLYKHAIHHAKEVCVVSGDNRKRIHTHLFSPINPLLPGTSARPIFETKGFLDNAQDLKYLLFEGYDSRLALENLNVGTVRKLQDWAHFEIGNASLPREQILEIGGFDERFHDWGLADEDTAFRLHSMGLPFRYETRAFSLQQHTPIEEINYKQVAQDLHHFQCKHPELSSDEIEGFILDKHFPNQ